MGSSAKATRKADLKFFGFERVREHYDQVIGSRFGVAFDSLFRRPLEAINPFPMAHLQLVPKKVGLGNCEFPF